MLAIMKVKALEKIYKGWYGLKELQVLFVGLSSYPENNMKGAKWAASLVGPWM